VVSIGDAREWDVRSDVIGRRGELEAVDRFVEPRPWAPVAVMITYHVGQALIVAGVIRPEDIESDITNRFERFFTLASGIDHMESRSLLGVSLIKVIFQPGTNADADVDANADADPDVHSDDHVDAEPVSDQEEWSPRLLGRRGQE